MKASVIIPVMNGELVIGECLSALLNQVGIYREEYEVLVVDDGSTDSTTSVVERYNVRLIHQENAGPAAARNAGARAAFGEVLLFTDADCIPASDWLIKMLEPFKNPLVTGAKGVYTSKQTEVVARFVQCEYEQKYQKMSQLASIDFIDTYSAAYRREVFLGNGGFNESYPVPSVEDQEFSFRLAQRGYCLVFQPQAIVAHTHDRNLQEYWNRKFGIGYWKVFLLRTHPEKTFSDSHTPVSQRLQIGFLALAIIGLVMDFIFGGFFWFIMVDILFFYGSGFYFLSSIYLKDRKIIFSSLFILGVRATALGLGIVCGVLFPPDFLRRIGLMKIGKERHG